MFGGICSTSGMIRLTFLPKGMDRRISGKSGQAKSIEAKL
jgi:hypothetical protein